MWKVLAPLSVPISERKRNELNEIVRWKGRQIVDAMKLVSMLVY
jgi:hypothetical protein